MVSSKSLELLDRAAPDDRIRVKNALHLNNRNPAAKSIIPERNISTRPPTTVIERTSPRPDPRYRTRKTAQNLHISVENAALNASDNFQTRR
jgi:hypothetical protein